MPRKPRCRNEFLAVQYALGRPIRFVQELVKRGNKPSSPGAPRGYDLRIAIDLISEICNLKWNSGFEFLRFEIDICPAGCRTHAGFRMRVFVQS